ncbi:hypothetical protein M413DRAFT_19633 [Hebeloma cylindrosporum]|uniref:LsmAD domain-containing protein n=1 Tax=Hebeloma cylindrosporum TaxID=76867 RepID=A0A0C3C8G6_HEBCY|nr:hypothetical protein M413DRAFT_19633 [Hebeloma cylindrosporum h7]
MATTRQSKGPRKGPADAPVSRRAPAWGTGARASPTFSSAGRQQPQQPPATPTPAPLPPQPNGTRSDSAPPRDRVLQALSGLTGTTITLLTKSAQRYEGVIASTSNEPDMTGITLKDVKDVTNPGAPLKDSLFIPATNIDSYNSGPADAKPTNGDSFRTDTDISQKKPAPGRERDLQAWVPSGDAHPALSADDDTFGPLNGTSWDQFSVNEQLFGVKASFDEDLYTTKLDRSAPDFKERERKAQKIANEIIGAVTSNPHVAEERGNVVDDSGANEEERYGAVVRGQNAYVPPGARKGGPLPPSQPAPGVAGEASAKADAIPKVSINGPDGSVLPPTQTPAVKSTASTPGIAPTVTTNPPADAVPAFRQFVTNEKQRLTQKRQALAKSDMDKRMAELVKFSQSFKLNKPMPDDLVPILAKDEERQRQIKEKAEKDAASGLAPTASRGLPVAGAKIVERKPVPPALAGKGGAAGAATASGVAPAPSGASTQKTLSAANAAASSSSGAMMGSAVKPAAKAVSAVPSSAGAKKINMVIQSIPPFKGGKAKASASASTSAAATPQASGAGANGTPAGNAPVNASKTINQTNAHRVRGATISPAAAAPSPISPNTAAANRLNINASSFRPNPKANAFTPVVNSPKNGPGGPGPNQNVPATAPVSAANAASPKVKTESAPGTPNPFFGTRPIKKSTPVHVKDDFNPFKHNKVVDASQVLPSWQYTGKRYMQMFPPQHPPPQHGAQMQPPVPTPIPPPSYEEDSAAQAAAQQQHRGYVYYPPYGYPPQHMMPGMPPPGPPGAYMPGPYMQHMPYPPGMPPPNDAT